MAATSANIDSRGRLAGRGTRSPQAARTEPRPQVWRRTPHIKPSFLMTHIDGKLVVKLADFGLARTEGDDDFKVTATVPRSALSIAVAPRAKDSRRRRPFDIYSLGCTVYHLTDSRQPRGGCERLMKHTEARRPTFATNCRVSRRRVLKKMLAKKPRIATRRRPVARRPGGVNPHERCCPISRPAPPNRAGKTPAAQLPPAAISGRNRPGVRKPLPPARARGEGPARRATIAALHPGHQRTISSKTTGNILTGRPRLKPADRHPPSMGGGQRPRRASCSLAVSSAF
jgi:serine/threonine protein kinase